MRREDRLRMYQQYPEALAEQVNILLLPIHDDEGVSRHNIALGHITRLCSAPRPGKKDELEIQDKAILKRLSKRVAQTVINVASHEVARMDVKAARIELGQGEQKR